MRLLAGTGSQPQQRARGALLEPNMALEAWDDSTEVRFDRQLWNELCSLRFLEEAFSVHCPQGVRGHH